MILQKAERGIALITALVLSLIAVVLVAGIMNMVLTSTKQSGSIKRYTSSLEATKGGVEEFISALKTDSWTSTSSNNWISGHNCKLRRSTVKWPTVCNFCGNTTCTSNSNPWDIINYADWQKNYGSYTVYGKIIDCKDYPDGYIYNIELVGTDNSTREMTWIQVLYQLTP